MPNVSGTLLFNPTRVIPPVGSGIPNIPIVIQDTTTGNGAVALTNGAGNYLFTNVPAGNYRIVEAFGTPGGLPSPVDFSVSSSIIPVPTPLNPPVGLVPSPPAGTDVIDSLSPNTLLVTVLGVDLTGQDFIDAPIQEMPFVFSGLTIVGPNLVTAGNNGEFELFSPGTAVNTSPAVDPYPGLVPGFTYVQAGLNLPSDGSFTYANIYTFFSFAGLWWRLSNHTTYDETSSFLMVGGSTPGALFFTQTITVSPNTLYLFSTWIINLINQIGLAPPALGITVRDGATILFNTTLTAIPVSDPPTWIEQGAIINTGTSTNITIEFFSAGPAADGNDYAVDDISFREVEVDPVLSVNKEVDSSCADIGDILTYTTTITNIGSVTAENIIFTDVIPIGTAFVPNSVIVDGVSESALNPDPPGFMLSDLAPTESHTVEFQVIVTNLPQPPDPNPVENFSTVDFEVVFSQGIPPFPITENSNTVFTRIVLSNFKQISIDSKITIPSVKPDIEDILNIDIEPEATNTRIIQTMPSVSLEGQILTANKLIIDGRLNTIIEYVADDTEQTVHAAESSKPFSCFLVIPEEFEPEFSAKITFIVENIYYKKLDERTVFVSVTLYVKANFIE